MSSNQLTDEQIAELEQRLADFDRCVGPALGIEGEGLLAMEAAAWSLRGERDGLRAQVEAMHLALRNCLALARAKQRKEERPGDWSDIERFCASAGVVNSIATAFLSCDAETGDEEVGLLRGALEEIRAAWPYAGDYFEEKWRDRDLEARIDAERAEVERLNLMVKDILNDEKRARESLSVERARTERLEATASRLVGLLREAHDAMDDLHAASMNGSRGYVKEYDVLSDRIDAELAREEER